jgi:hypothetical protein
VPRLVDTWYYQLWTHTGSFKKKILFLGDVEACQPYFFLPFSFTSPFLNTTQRREEYRAYRMRKVRKHKLGWFCTILTEFTNFAQVKSNFTGFRVLSPSLHIRYMLTRVFDNNSLHHNTKHTLGWLHQSFCPYNPYDEILQRFHGLPSICNLPYFSKLNSSLI